MNFLKSTITASRIIKRSSHLDFSPNWKLSKKIWDRYRKLPIANCKTQATYVWIDAKGCHPLCKTRTMDYIPTCPKDCPVWDCNAKKARFAGSDIILMPVAVYDDPITQNKNKLVLCDTYTDDGHPTPSNHRHKCQETLNKIKDKEPEFCFEQEFQFMDLNQRPYGWPIMQGEPCPLPTYYCAVGADRAFGREIMECFYRCCLYCGIEIDNVKPQGLPAQWEFENGPSAGIKAADDLWMARFLLHRIAEDFGVAVSFHPKLLPHWKGAACRTGFSTKEMRAEGGYKYIEQAVKELEKKHAEHMKIYDLHGGEDNKLRLCGEFGTCVSEKFTFGVAEKNFSVRVTKKVNQEKKGFFQDRRPAANCDPYRVANAIASSVCGK